MQYDINMAMLLTLELPEEIGAYLISQDPDLPRSALEALALEKYKSGQLTQAQLATLLGLGTRLDADAFLKEHGVDLEYTLEDLDRDLQAHLSSGL